MNKLLFVVLVILFVSFVDTSLVLSTGTSYITDVSVSNDDLKNIIKDQKRKIGGN